MNRRRLNCHLFCSLIFLLASSCQAASPKNMSLTVLYTSQANGQIRSCNCTKFRFGGYGREATMLQKIKPNVPNPVVIDGGDIIDRLRSSGDKLKAEVALKSIAAMGYSALAPGDAEVMEGLDALYGLQGANKVPFVLANVENAGRSGRYKPYVVYKTKGNLRVALIGLLGPDLLGPLPVSGTKASDMIKAFRKTLPQARKSSDLVLALCHSSEKEALKVAQAGGADVVICTHSYSDIMMPKKEGNTVETPAKMVGGCLFIVNGTRSNWSVGRLDLQFAGGKAKTFRNRLIYLDRTYDESPGIIKFYEDYNKRLKQALLTQNNAFKSQVLNSLKARGFDRGARQQKLYAGSESCRDCHKDAYQVWSKSRHGSAFASLRKRNQDFDPECVDCHTIGSGRPGGFVNADRTPDLINVGCESCHGSAASHAAKPAEASLNKVTEERCRSCHTDERNPDFDYDKLWKLIAH